MVGTSKPIQKHRLTKLLFVDDEEGIRLTLPLLLHARGFDVRVAVRGSIRERWTAPHTNWEAKLSRHSFPTGTGRRHIETSEEGPDRVRSNPVRIGGGARETVNF